MIDRLEDFVEHVRALARGGDLNRALGLIRDFVIAVISRDASIARVFSSPRLDDLCLEFGRSFAIAKPGIVDDDRAVFMVTGVHSIGGHSRVLLDLISADPASHTTVLVSNTLQGLKAEDVAKVVMNEDVTVELAPDGNDAQRLFWMQQRLHDLRPARTYILQHHFDPLCVAAAQPELVGRLFYFHNADHSLTLGAHIPHATHIDFHAKGFFNCREQLGISENVFWPLTVEIPEAPARRAFLRDRRLITCCCGGFEKFELPHMLEAFPYSISYSEMVARILCVTGGTHVHVGKLTDRLVAEIKNDVREAGLLEDQFEFVTYTPSLAGFLVERGIDVYMGSMPRGGGRATVEAMAAGMPMLIHSNYRTIFFSDENELYPGALVWRTLDEMAEKLASWTPDVLERHAIDSRAFYEERHTPTVLSEALRKTLAGEPGFMPLRPNHRPDPLQDFLDRRRAYAALGLSAIE